MVRKEEGVRRKGSRGGGGGEGGAHDFGFLGVHVNI